MKKAVAYLTPFMEAEKAAGGTVQQARAKILLATVKGDVHDIGKNIVGVVLGCNNFEVIDLGVMVSCETILETARKENVDIIGLSGLITPSLDEMVHVGREMKRTGFKLPLLIGGATTSAKHTAVKIAPGYAAEVIHVLDASRSVGVVEKLINPEVRPKFDVENRELQKQLVASYDKRQDVKLVPYAEALAKRFTTDWATVDIPKPEFTGTRVLENVPLTDASRIHRLVAVLPDLGAERQVSAHLRRSAARRSGAQVVRRRQRAARSHHQRKTAHGPRRLRLLAGGQRRRRHHRLRRRIARQRALPLPRAAATVGTQRPECVSTRSPTSSPPSTAAARITSAPSPSRPASAPTSLPSKFDSQHDDYNSILTKALADRLAEAFAEYLHAEARRDWGFGEAENFRTKT